MSKRITFTLFLVLAFLINACEKKPIEQTPEEKTKLQKHLQDSYEKSKSESQLYKELQRRNALQSGEWKGTYSDANNQMANVMLDLTNGQGSISGKITIQFITEDKPEPSYSAQFIGKVRGDTITCTIVGSRDSNQKTQIIGRWMNENGVNGATQVMYGFIMLPPAVSYLDGGTWILRRTASPLPPAE